MTDSIISHVHKVYINGMLYTVYSADCFYCDFEIYQYQYTKI